MDRASVEQLYVRFAPMVRARAGMLLRSDQAAEDAVHDVFVRVLRAGRTFRMQASPATWLYRITTNHCLNALRDEARRAQLWLHHGAVTEPTAEPGAATRIQLQQILSRVRDDLQEIALYHLIDELSHGEIAELIGVSRRTIGNRIEQFRTEIALALGATEAS